MKFRRFKRKIAGPGAPQIIQAFKKKKFWGGRGAFELFISRKTF